MPKFSEVEKCPNFHDWSFLLDLFKGWQHWGFVVWQSWYCQQGDLRRQYDVCRYTWRLNRFRFQNIPQQSSLTLYRAKTDHHWRSCPKEPYKLDYQTRPVSGYHQAELVHWAQCWTTRWTSYRWTRWSRPWWPGWRPRTTRGCCRAGT